MKKRLSQGIVCTSPCAPRPRDSMRTLATWVELTVLPAWIARGSIVPLKRNTSTFWFTPICFSTVTTRWPFGSTSTTVAVIEPWKVLALSVPPLPAKFWPELAVALARLNELAYRKGRAEMPASMPLFLSMVEVDFWLALTFSMIAMVTLSPTSRARRSSKSGR